MKTTKYVIGKRFSFSASHQLNGLPDTHQCSRLHGHNYTIEVVIGSDELNATGFVLDYGELEFVKDYINNNFDHRHLNDVMVVNTTAENISKLFYDFVSLYLRENYPNVKLIKVIVSETEKTFSSYAT